MGTEERRRYKRVDRKFMVKFRVIGGSLPRDIADRVGIVTNLSQGGVILVSKRPLPVETLMDMEFPDSAFGSAKSLAGKIVWLRLAETGDALHGVQFVRVSDETRRRYGAPEPDEEAKEPEPAAPATSTAARGSERRKYKRWEQKLLLKIRCITPGPWMEVEARGAMLIDISKGGVEIETTREYMGNVVLEMYLPESPLGPARTYHARVVRSRGAEKPGRYRLGCAFVRLTRTP